MAVSDLGLLRWSWQVVRGRPRLFIGMLCGLAVAPLLPAGIKGATRAIIAWDIGVVAFLVMSAFLFTTERLDRMAADAADQEEGGIGDEVEQVIEPAMRIITGPAVQLGLDLQYPALS